MSVLGEIKFITELLIQCEGDFTIATGASTEVYYKLAHHHTLQ